MNNRRAVRRQVCRNAVIPAKAGIQTKEVNPVFLAPRLRGGDEKTELVDGLYRMAPLLAFI